MRCDPKQELLLFTRCQVLLENSPEKQMTPKF